MSDKLSEHEVSDVLASIRRLVSHRPGSALAAPAMEPVEAEPDPVPEPVEEPDKLVLTPSLRVSDAAAPEPDAAPVELLDEAQMASEDTEAPWSLEDRIAELEQALGTETSEWEPDGSEDPDQETPTSFVFQHRPLKLNVQVPNLPPVVEIEGPEAVEEPSDEVTEPEADASENVAAAVEEVDETQPPAAEPSEPGSLDDLNLESDGLRDLVAEIVREELRGELGERMTRNLRKLVRREIHRALLSRDFE